MMSGDDGDVTMNRPNYREAEVWTRFNATAGPPEGESDERARGGWEPAVFDLGRRRVRRRVGIGGTALGAIAALLSSPRCPLSSACVLFINAQVVHRLATHADHQARAT
jgi:hypothetical protein